MSEHSWFIGSVPLIIGLFRCIKLELQSMLINVQIDIKRSERARLLLQLSPERGNGV